MLFARFVIEQLPLCGLAVTVNARPADNLMVHKALQVAEVGDIVVVQTGGNTTSAVFGEPIQASGTPLYTDARLFCERGIPAVLYGGGPRMVLQSNAKRADEHIELEDLRRATKVIARTLVDLLA